MKWLIAWGPAVIWMAVIFILSHQPGSGLNAVLPFFQRWFPLMKSFNWGHFVSYFVLALTFYWAVTPRHARWRGKVLAVLLSVLYGITDELHQVFVPDRTADWMDIRNDAIGAVLAMLAVSIPPLHRLFLRVRTFRQNSDQSFH